MLKISLACRRYASREDKRPPSLPLGLWTWMPKVWHISQADVVRLAGMDAAMHLRVLAFGRDTHPFQSSDSRLVGASSLSMRCILQG